MQKVCEARAAGEGPGSREGLCDSANDVCSTGAWWERIPTHMSSDFLANCGLNDLKGFQ